MCISTLYYNTLMNNILKLLLQTKENNKSKSTRYTEAFKKSKNNNNSWPRFSKYYLH